MKIRTLRSCGILVDSNLEKYKSGLGSTQVNLHKDT